MRTKLAMVTAMVVLGIAAVAPAAQGEIVRFEDINENPNPFGSEVSVEAGTLWVHHSTLEFICAGVTLDGTVSANEANPSTLQINEGGIDWCRYNGYYVSPEVISAGPVEIYADETGKLPLKIGIDFLAQPWESCYMEMTINLGEFENVTWEGWHTRVEAEKEFDVESNCPHGTWGAPSRMDGVKIDGVSGLHTVFL